MGYNFHTSFNLYDRINYDHKSEFRLRRSLKFIELFKEIMPKLRTYRIFISHAWDYHESYDRLVDILDKAPNFEWYNHSVPKDEPIVAPDEDASKKELTQELIQQIEGVHCVLVIAGMYATHSYWIEKELDLFVRLEKPIIGIAPWGQEQIPRVVQDVATEMVG